MEDHLDNVRIVDDNSPMDEGRSITGGESFMEFSETLPEDAATGFAIAQPSPISDSVPGNDEGFGVMGDVAEPSSTPGTRRIKMSRKMKKAMDKIKQKVGTFPILWFNAKAAQHPEWALDDEEKEIIKDSLEFVFEILNIEFNIQTLDYTLTSIWWVIAYPIAAIGMIFMIKSSAYKAANPEEAPDAK